ncbi:MAG: hypothetical protein PIR02_02620 [Microbacterium enclense]
MKTAPRVLGILSLLAALGAIGVQVLVVGLLWAAFTQPLPLQSTLLLGTAGALLGFALAVVGAILRRGVGPLLAIAGLMNLGLLAAYAYLFSIL